jgi:hypothetical protein
MLERRHRSGVLDKKFTLHRVIHDRILKQAQQELRRVCDKFVGGKS